MPNSPHPLTAAIAARLPADCPESVLLEAQRKFMLPLLEANLAEALAEQGETSKYNVNHAADQRVGRAKQLIEFLPRAGFRTMLDWIQEVCPPSINARDAFLALTYDARRAWAKEMVYEIGASSPGWDAIAPDMQDAIAAEVAEAWIGGVIGRNMRYAFRQDQKHMVKRMSQAALYKWLLEPERESWEIKEYFAELHGKYAKRLQDQFNPAQWADILLAVAPSTGDPQVDARIASAERDGYIG